MKKTIKMFVAAIIMVITMFAITGCGTIDGVKEDIDNGKEIVVSTYNEVVNEAEDAFDFIKNSVHEKSNECKVKTNEIIAILRR